MLSSGSVQEAADLALGRPHRHPGGRAYRSSTSSTDSAPRTRSTRRSPSPTRQSTRLLGEHVLAHRHRALSSDNPVLRLGAEPGRLFQARETANPSTWPAHIVQDVMDRFTARPARLSPVSITWALRCRPRPGSDGSGAGAAEELIEHSTRRARRSACSRSPYRPFASEAFLAALPKTVKSIAVLDRCKSPPAG